MFASDPELYTVTELSYPCTRICISGLHCYGL